MTAGPDRSSRHCALWSTWRVIPQGVDVKQALGKGLQASLCSVIAVVTDLQALRGIYAGIGGHRPARRMHYIQAERVSWNYAPRASEGNLCGPKPVPFNPIEVSSHCRTTTSGLAAPHWIMLPTFHAGPDV